MPVRYLVVLEGIGVGKENKQAAGSPTRSRGQWRALYMWLIFSNGLKGCQEFQIQLQSLRYLGRYLCQRREQNIFKFVTLIHS